MRARLVEDHKRARRIAEGLAATPGFVVDLAAVQTNIVFVRLEKLDPARIVDEAAKERLRLYATGPRQIRLVTVVSQAAGDSIASRSAGVSAYQRINASWTASSASASDPSSR